MFIAESATGDSAHGRNYLLLAPGLRDLRIAQENSHAIKITVPDVNATRDLSVNEQAGHTATSSTVTHKIQLTHAEILVVRHQN
jgi:hypothetical protein